MKCKQGHTRISHPEPGLVVSCGFSCDTKTCSLAASFNQMFRKEKIPDYECLSCRDQISTSKLECFVSLPNLLMCHVIRLGSSFGTESKDCRSTFFPQWIYVDKDIGVSSYAYPSFLNQTDYKHIDHWEYDINTSISGTDFILRTLRGTDEFLSGSKVYKYYLKSIIHHIGTSSLEGHYVVDVLSEKRSCAIWLRYDEQTVTEVP